MRAPTTGRVVVILAVFLSSLAVYYTIKSCCRFQDIELELKSLKNEKITEIREIAIDRFTPLIFVGGSLRSGTTLMRTMIESHPDIKCGPETGLIPAMLNKMQIIDNLHYEVGNTELYHPMGNKSLSIFDEAFANFLLEIIHELNKPSKYYCNKDPLNLKFTSILEKLFPNCKLVLMVRDFRAISNSFREVRLDKKGIPVDYRGSLIYLNTLYDTMVSQCNASKNCIIQQYEQLVLQPIKETQKLFKFFDIPWTEEVLKHDKHLDNIKFNPNEFTTDQVQKPLYLDGLTKWFGTIPPDVLRDLPRLAPIMTTLGYDVTHAEPYYGGADDFVMKRVMK